MMVAQYLELVKIIVEMLSLAVKRALSLVVKRALSLAVKRALSRVESALANSKTKKFTKKKNYVADVMSSSCNEETTTTTKKGLYWTIRQQKKHTPTANRVRIRKYSNKQVQPTKSRTQHTGTRQSSSTKFNQKIHCAECKHVHNAHDEYIIQQYNMTKTFTACYFPRNFMQQTSIIKQQSVTKHRNTIP